MGKCVFNDRWLEDDDYKSWLEREKSDKHKGYCRVFKKTVELGKMGEGTLVSHMKGKKHRELLKASKPAVLIAGFLGQSKTVTQRSSTVSSTFTSQTSTP